MADNKTEKSETATTNGGCVVGILFYINLINYMDRLAIAGMTKYDKGFYSEAALKH